MVWKANVFLLACCASMASAASMDCYNVVWETPSQDASGQMPLGNGDIAAGVYAIEDGDLYLLLSKNDAFTYNGDIFKTGRVKIKLNTNPIAKGKPFRQTLDLKTGSMQLDSTFLFVGLGPNELDTACRVAGA